MPGLGVKRWFLIVLAGITFIAVGAALFLLDFYRTTPDAWWLPLLSYVSLRFLIRPVRVLIFGGIGLGILGWGIWGLNRSLMEPFVPRGRPVVDQLATFRRRERGPRLVAIGGGTGLATLLRGLKTYTHNLTAIVSVADDGGSSGRLRKSLGILPPGDIRNCLAALSNDEQLISQLFQYRFAQSQDTGLEGHSFGNLFLTVMTEITGSFEHAIAESGRVLAANGTVLPATLQNVTLEADVLLPQADGEVRVKGESRIPETEGNIRRVWLSPGSPSAYPKAVQAILGADLLVVGPGSLYTSVLPNLLVPDLAAAMRSSQALKVYVCNVATQPGETRGYSVADHLQALEEHIGRLPFDIILCNRSPEPPAQESVDWVRTEEAETDRYSYHYADMVDRFHPRRHDSTRLAQTLIALFQERTGPLAAL